MTGSSSKGVASGSEGSGGSKRYVVGVLEADKFKESIPSIEQMIA